MNPAKEEWPTDYFTFLPRDTLEFQELGHQRTVPPWTELVMHMLLLLHLSVLSYSWRFFHAIVCLEERATSR